LEVKKLLYLPKANHYKPFVVVYKKELSFEREAISFEKLLKNKRIEKEIIIRSL